MLQTSTYATGGYTLDPADEKFEADPLNARAQQVLKDRGYAASFLRDEEVTLPLMDRLISHGIKTSLKEIRDLMRQESEFEARLNSARTALDKAKSELTGLLDSLPTKGEAA
jgi:hypothetical protein